MAERQCSGTGHCIQAKSGVRDDKPKVAINREQVYAATLSSPISKLGAFFKQGRLIRSEGALVGCQQLGIPPARHQGLGIPASRKLFAGLAVQSQGKGTLSASV